MPGPRPCLALWALSVSSTVPERDGEALIDATTALGRALGPAYLEAWERYGALPRWIAFGEAVPGADAAIRDRLQQSLERAGISYRTLADAAGIAPTTITMLMRPGAAATLATATAIAAVLGVSPGWLAFGGCTGRRGLGGRLSRGGPPRYQGSGAGLGGAIENPGRNALPL